MCVHTCVCICMHMCVWVYGCGWAHVPQTGDRVFKYLSLWRMVDMARLNQHMSLLVPSLFHATHSCFSLFFSPHFLSFSLSFCSPPPPCVCVILGVIPAWNMTKKAFLPICWLSLHSVLSLLYRNFLISCSCICQFLGLVPGLLEPFAGSSYLCLYCQVASLCFPDRCSGNTFSSYVKHPLVFYLWPRVNSPCQKRSPWGTIKSVSVKCLGQELLQKKPTQSSQ